MSGVKAARAEQMMPLWGRRCRCRASCCPDWYYLLSVSKFYFVFLDGSTLVVASELSENCLNSML